MSALWELAVGAEVTRAEVKSRYGGGTQNGIESSTTSPNVLVYSDPKVGFRHGYTFDGWAVDNKDLFFYTGEGQSGDQKMDNKNLSLREHVARRKALRLFVATGAVHKPGGKVHRYLGEFAVDSQDPWVPEVVPTAGGGQRTVIVFRLRPTGFVEHRPEDSSKRRDVASKDNCVDVPLEENIRRTYTISGRDPGEAYRREAALMARFTALLTGMGHDVCRQQLTPAGEHKPLLTDIYDKTTAKLYEAKGTTKREDIRQAIGQLIDYGRFLSTRNPELIILVPARPSDDLIRLIKTAGMSCMYETDLGSFERVEGGPPATGHHSGTVQAISM